MTLKELMIKLGLDLDAQSFFKAELASHAVEKGLHLIGEAAHFAAHALESIVEGVVDTGVRASRLSQSLGINAQDLQRMAYVGSFAGLSMDDMARSLKFMNKQMAKTGHGAEDPREFLAKVADQFAGMPDGPLKTAKAMKLFGRQGLQMIPLLNQGAKAIEALGDQADESGNVLSEAQIKMAEEVHHAENKLRKDWDGLKLQVGAKLMPVLLRLLEWAEHWWEKNKETVKQGLLLAFKAIFKVGNLLYRFVLKPMGKMLGFLIKNWKLVGLVLTAVLLALTPAIVAFGVESLAAGLTAAAGWLAAAAPLILMTALLLIALLVVDDLIVAFRGGDSFLAEMWHRLIGFIDEWTQFDPADSGWMTFLKSLVETVFHFRDAWVDAWHDIKRAAAEFFDWLDSKLSIISGLKKQLGITDLSQTAAKVQTLASQATVQAKPLESANQLLTVGRILTSPITGPVFDRLGQRLPGPTVDQKNTLTINVQAGPGEAHETLVGKIRDHVEDFFTGKMRETAEAVGR